MHAGQERGGGPRVIARAVAKGAAVDLRQVAEHVDPSRYGSSAFIVG